MEREEKALLAKTDEIAIIFLLIITATLFLASLTIPVITLLLIPLWGTFFVAGLWIISGVLMLSSLATLLLLIAYKQKQAEESKQIVIS